MIIITLSTLILLLGVVCGFVNTGLQAHTDRLIQCVNRCDSLTYSKRCDLAVIDAQRSIRSRIIGWAFDSNRSWVLGYPSIHACRETGESWLTECQCLESYEDLYRAIRAVVTFGVWPFRVSDFCCDCIAPCLDDLLGPKHSLL